MAVTRNFPPGGVEGGFPLSCRGAGGGARGRRRREGVRVRFRLFSARCAGDGNQERGAFLFPGGGIPGTASEERGRAVKRVRALGDLRCMSERRAVAWRGAFLDFTNS